MSNSVTPMVYDGMAGASSIYSDSYIAQNAFDQEDPDARWSSTAGYPGKIWFKFTSAVKVAKLSFSSVQSIYWKESPKAFNVIASNDCRNWEILLSVTNSGFTGENQEKSWQIPCTQKKSYQCYGIEGTENLGYGTDYISLKKMKMFQWEFWWDVRYRHPFIDLRCPMPCIQNCLNKNGTKIYSINRPNRWEWNILGWPSGLTCSGLLNIWSSSILYFRHFCKG